MLDRSASVPPPGRVGPARSGSRHGLALALITSLFLLWGLANSLNDVLVAQFKKAFVLTDLQSGLVQSAFYFGYFALALPAARFAQVLGYKAAVLAGLSLYGTGALLFYPAAEARTYGFFLGALFVIAGGLAFLETAANPLVVKLGDSAGAERRLNFAQAFNPLGAITGVVLGRELILSGVEPDAAELAAMTPQALAHFYEREALAVQGPYLALGLLVLLWAALVALTRFPDRAHPPAARTGGPTFGAALRALAARPPFVFAVAAQFAYVGAQVGIWSYMIRYGQAEAGMGEKAAAAWLTGSLVAFMIGRFIGTALMARVESARLMLVFAAVNIALALFAAMVGGLSGLAALAATGFFMSVMFPTIFAVALRGLGPLTETGSGLLVMSIVGGAVITAAMGQLSDATSIRTAVLVPALCFAAVAAFALSALRDPSAGQGQKGRR